MIAVDMSMEYSLSDEENLKAIEQAWLYSKKIGIDVRLTITQYPSIGIDTKQAVLYIRHTTESFFNLQQAYWTADFKKIS